MCWEQQIQKTLYKKYFTYILYIKYSLSTLKYIVILVYMYYPAGYVYPGIHVLHVFVTSMYVCVPGTGYSSLKYFKKKIKKYILKYILSYQVPVEILPGYPRPSTVCCVTVCFFEVNQSFAVVPVLLVL
jgi:hypothetical protein